jgi:hypothetical protein
MKELSDYVEMVDYPESSFQNGKKGRKPLIYKQID